MARLSIGAIGDHVYKLGNSLVDAMGPVCAKGQQTVARLAKANVVTTAVLRVVREVEQQLQREQKRQREDEDEELRKHNKKKRKTGGR